MVGPKGEMVSHSSQNITLFTPTLNMTLTGRRRYRPKKGGLKINDNRIKKKKKAKSNFNKYCDSKKQGSCLVVEDMTKNDSHSGWEWVVLYGSLFIKK